MKKPNSKNLLKQLTIRASEEQHNAIAEIAAKPGWNSSKVIRRALSLGLPWVIEPTIGGRMRSMKEALLLIGKEASERKRETTILEHLIGAFASVPNTPDETQIQINNMISFTKHIVERLGTTLDAIKAAQIQLTKFEALTPQDCKEMCHYLAKVAAASTSVDRKRRLEEMAHLFRSMGGI